MQNQYRRQKTIAKLLGAASAIAGACAAQPALATTATAPTNFTVSASGGNCFVNFSAAITGTIDDGSGADQYYIIPVSGGNTLAFSPRSVAVGSTDNGPHITGFSSTANITGPVEVGIFEKTSTPAAGAKIVSAFVPPNLFQAAGGACANVPQNFSPTVDAGTNQSVAEGDTVNLSGTASDTENDPLTFAWTQTGGASVSLSGANTLTPSFTAPAKLNAIQTLTFRLVANDGNSSSAPDSVNVSVAANIAPVANPGTGALINGGDTVNLDGTASSDVDGDPLTYSWSQAAGPTVTLTNPTSATPSFVAPAKTNSVQPLIFSLTVNDGLTNSAQGAVEYNVAANIGPTADAGPDATVGGGTTVTLDGSGSADGDGDAITYQWMQTSGPALAISGANTANPSFQVSTVLSGSQTFTFDLVVDDGLTMSVADSVTITVPANAPPSVDAGPDQTVAGGSQVSLAGTGADAEGDPLTYSWAQTAGTAVTLTGATSQTPSFTAPAKTAAQQVLTFELIANDGTTNSSPDSVDIIILGNTGPTADAGADQNVSGNSTVTLDASGSVDGDGDTLTYLWTQTAGPTVMLSGANTVNPTFTAPAGLASAQTLTFQVEVSDGFATATGGGVTDTVDIQVSANRAPIADAGADFGPIDSGQSVMLDGSGSSDPDGDGLTYAWTQVSGTTVTLTGANTATPSFAAPLVAGTEDLVFSLIVNDGSVASAPDTVTVGIRAVGSVTIIQQVVGADTTVAFTSDVASLNSSITTSGGVGQLNASSVSAGPHSISAADLSSAGYTVTAITCNDNDSTVDLASRSVAIELSPSEDLVCTFSMANSREAASAAINNFLTGRNALILAHQPDLQRRLDRLQGGVATPGSASAYGLSVPGSGKLPVGATLAAGQAQVSTSLNMVSAATGGASPRSANPFDIWAEAYFSGARIGEQEGRFSIIYAGADYRVNDSLLVGALVGFDNFNDDGRLEAGEAEGDGWLAGPYVTARVAPQLFAELRAAWGQSNNLVSPLGSFADEFETSRSYYSGSLIGHFNLGANTVIQPEVTIRHISERAEDYTDSLNITIPSQTVSQGDISFKPRISHVITSASGWSLRPYAEAEGIYAFSASDGMFVANLTPADARIGDFGDLRMRVEAGLDLFSGAGLRATASAFHDGIGSASYSSTGVQVGVSFGF